jgi:ribosomal protein L37AE/L43A
MLSHEFLTAFMKMDAQSVRIHNITGTFGVQSGLALRSTTDFMSRNYQQLGFINFSPPVRNVQPANMMSLKVRDPNDSQRMNMTVRWSLSHGFVQIMGAKTVEELDYMEKLVHGVYTALGNVAGAYRPRFRRTIRNKYKEMGIPKQRGRPNAAQKQHLENIVRARLAEAGMRDEAIVDRMMIFLAERG